MRASSMASFSASLTESLEAIAPTARATSRTALQRLGPAWFDRKKSPMFDLALSAWLSELEETHRLLLLEGDPPDDNDDEDDDNDDDGGGGGRRGRGGAAKRKSSRYSSNRRGQLPKTSSTVHGQSMNTKIVEKSHTRMLLCTRCRFLAVIHMRLLQIV